MKILIAYAGKSGTTEKCAKLLEQKLPGAVLADLNRETPEIGSYDAVIIGGSIRMGQLHKKAKEYLEQNAAGLKAKKAAYFICCGTAESAPQLFETNFPKELLAGAVSYECFGGELNPDRLHGIDKFIAIMVSKAPDPQKTAPHILEENIAKLASTIQKAAQGA
jgi:menaquinone-dependent protoporphyrinogen oxidase